MYDRVKPFQVRCLHIPEVYFLAGNGDERLAEGRLRKPIAVQSNDVMSLLDNYGRHYGTYVTLIARQ